MVCYLGYLNSSVMGPWVPTESGSYIGTPELGRNNIQPIASPRHGHHDGRTDQLKGHQLHRQVEVLTVTNDLTDDQHYFLADDQHYFLTWSDIVFQ